MVDLQRSDAAEYLGRRLHIPSDQIAIRELAGGVSSAVLLAEAPGVRLVLKQSLAQLRVAEDWFCGRERIWQEAAALRMLSPVMPSGSIPEVVFEDRENYLYAMTAAPADAETWKAQLLRGECDASVAEEAGLLLARLFRAGWNSPEMALEYGNRQVFEELRLTPYYRQCAERHPDLAVYFDDLADNYAQRCCTLVHGDWSPKNLLVALGEVMAIDFEVIHYGDPAFDAGFLLNHLLLKTFHLPDLQERFAVLAEAFWASLIAEMPPTDWFASATMRHWAGLLLARVDGRSPAEYIRDESVKEQIRNLARSLILRPAASVQEVFERRATPCH